MSEERNLEFLQTMSTEEFKEAYNGGEPLKVKESKKGMFFTFRGGHIGAVSKSLSHNDDAVVSFVKGADGEQFWLLHKDTPAVMTF